MIPLEGTGSIHVGCREGEGSEREIETLRRNLMVVTGWEVWCFGRMIFPDEAGWMGAMQMNKKVEEGAEIVIETLLGKILTVELHFEHRGWMRL